MNELKYLKWDSIFFKKKVFELNVFEKTFNKNKLKYNLIQSNVKLMEKEKINYLEKEGFHLEELNIEFKKILEKKIDLDFKYKKAKEIDTKKLVEFSDFFKQSRYNIFGRKKVKEFYSEWIKNAILGEFDDVCFMIEKEMEVLGLVTLKDINSVQARIGLIVVNEKFQSSGVGKKLLKIAEKYCLDNNKKELFVSTQGSNLKAQNFYIKNGYLINEIGAWYYLLKEGKID